MHNNFNSVWFKKYGVITSCFLVMTAIIIVSSNLVGTSADITDSKAAGVSTTTDPATTTSTSTTSDDTKTTSTSDTTSTTSSSTTDGTSDSSTTSTGSGSDNTSTTSSGSSSTTTSPSGGGSGTTSSTSTTTSSGDGSGGTSSTTSTTGTTSTTDTTSSTTTSTTDSTSTTDKTDSTTTSTDYNCTTVYKPVCTVGSDGNKKTFSNECEAKKYGANIVDFNKSCESQDKSDSSDTTKYDYSTNQCKTNTNYYKSGNYYYMKAPATQGNVTDHMYRGPFDENCKPVNTANPPLKKDDSSLTCSTVYKPVCAITKENNKKTFDNECQAKKYGGNIVDFNKSCEDKSDGNKSEVICPKEYKPVCTVTPDGNKKTQDNECKAKAMGLKIVDSYKGCEHKAYDYSQDKKYDDKGNYDYKKDSERYKGGDDDKKYATTDVMYWLKDTERMVQDFKRYKLSEVKDGTKAKSILSKMEAKVKEARSEYDKGNSSKVQTLLKDVNDLRKSFEDSMDGFHNKKDREHIDKKMDFVKKEIEQMKLKLKKGSKNYDVCMKHANDGLAIVGKIKSAYAKEDWKTLESLKNTMMAIEDKASIDCRENYSNKADVNSFNTVYVDKKNYEISQTVIDQISKEVAKKVLENIKSNDNLVNKIYANSDATLAKDIAKMFESVSLAPKKEQQDMLSIKANMLEEIKSLKAQVSTLRAKNNEYEMLMTDIRKYNFTGAAGTKMQDELKKFNTYVSTGSVSDAEFKKKVATLKTEATKAKVQARYDKFSKGIIAFLDADDTEWYSQYAVQAKQLGYVKGTGDSGGVNLNPGGNTNVAEAVAMFGRVIGGDGEAGIIIQTGQTTKGLPSWSHAGAAALQKKGVNLDKLFNGKKADEKVTRAETAQLLKEVFKLSAGDASKFPDAKNASSAEKAAIGAVSAAGIMTGEGNGNFNSKGSLNRAAIVKVIMKAKEQNSVAATATTK